MKRPADAGLLFIYIAVQAYPTTENSAAITPRSIMTASMMQMTRITVLLIRLTLQDTNGPRP